MTAHPLNCKFAKGELLVLEYGEYSDFCYFGPFTVANAFDMAEQVAKLREAYPGVEDCDLGTSDLVAWLANHSLIEDAEHRAIHIGSYGSINLDQPYRGEGIDEATSSARHCKWEARPAISIQGQPLKSTDLGRDVIYRDRASVETGSITSFNERYVFVRYGSDRVSKATVPGNLEWSHQP